mmetsp:Transcript_19064/g.42370  ORF Transcript_19064/g.42370 Transcript_19064/m.42370 type:complete len:581 (+) Transcript_19064:97-1839(+)
MADTAPAAAATNTAGSRVDGPSLPSTARASGAEDEAKTVTSDRPVASRSSTRAAPLSTSTLTCASCGANGQNFKRCTACKSVHYCGRDCQASHWKDHRAECKKREKGLKLKAVLQGALCGFAADAESSASAAAAAAAPDGGDACCCWICMDDGADVNGFDLMRGFCVCRGGSGWVHPTCVANYGEAKCTKIRRKIDRQRAGGIAYRGDFTEFMTPYTECPNCKQSYHGPLGLALVEALVSYTNDVGVPRGAMLWLLTRIQLAFHLMEEPKRIGESVGYNEPLREDEPCYGHALRAKHVMEDILEVLGAGEEKSPDAHLDVEMEIVVIQNLAKCYECLGETDAQVNLLRKAHMMTSRPEYLSQGWHSRRQLFYFERDLERVTGQKIESDADTFVEELRQHIEDIRAVSGKNSYKELSTKDDLLAAIALRGDYLLAMDEADDAVSAAKRTLGPDHHVTQSLESARCYLLSATHYWLKNMPPTDSIRQDLLKAENEHGKDSEAAFRIRNHYIASLARNGQYNMAVAANKELLEDATKALGKEHELIPLIENNLYDLLAKDHMWLKDAPSLVGEEDGRNESNET